MVSWEAGNPANVYRGSIAALDASGYDHRGIGACDVASGTLAAADEAGSWYYLVSGTCDWGDGSLGRDSLGRERAPALDRCP